MPFDLTDAINTLSPSKRDLALQRVEWVHSAQRQYGMEPRNDSMLTYKYAIGNEEDDLPSSIAKELVFVDQLYKKTEYGRIIEDVLRGIAESMKSKYKLPWTETWEIVRFYGPTMLKLYCLTHSNINVTN